MLSINCDGIPEDEDAIKTDELVTNIFEHHIIILTETRTNDLDRILRYTPHHVLIGKKTMPENCVGRKGFGVAVLASKTAADFISLTRAAEQSHSVWAKIDKQLLNIDRDAILCAVYIRPESSTGHNHDVDNQYAHLEADLQQMKGSYHLLIGGDLNAQIGSLDEVEDADFELLLNALSWREVETWKPHRLTELADT